jgi:hypothetical protein
MRKSLLFLFLLCVASQSVDAQFRVSGSLADTTAQLPMTRAVVTLLSQKDSSLIAFTRTDSAGRFQTPFVPAGKYLVLITYPKFADLAEQVQLIDADKNLGLLALTPKSRLLQEVIIRANAAIRVKGDTTEFTADSFQVKAGATVEDLLKRLPGFSVNAKGEITTQGKRVDKVLVDGEEFFGDDPTMATQNLSARIVDRVQVYDTRTEQQNLTSVASGSEGKTLNIKLKEDKKKGGFGNMSIGTDFNRFLEARALFNKFKGKKKISLFATRSNVNTGSLNWGDKQKLGMDQNMEFDEISGYYYNFNTDDGFNDWNLRGYPDAYTGGGLFSNKWDNDRQNVNMSYRFNQLGNSNNSISTTQNILPGSNSFRYKNADSRGVNRQHVLNGKYEWKPDSLTSFKYTVTGLYKNSEIATHTYSHFLGNANDTVNLSVQDRRNASERRQLDQQLVWRQMFMKKGRLLITTIRYGIIEDEQRGKTVSDNRFYKNNIVDSIGLIDQQRNIDGNSRSLGAKTTLNEPLSSKLNLVLEYGYNINKSESYRNTYNKNTNGKYENLDTVFSNNFELDAYAHNGSATLKYQYKKWRFAAGSGLSNVTLRLHDLFTDKTNSYHFTNITPQAQVAFTPKAQTNINFNYRGTTRQPTINQLQPIRDNNDPLNVFIGNPALKVGFNHSIFAGFNKYKALKGIWMGFNANYNIETDAITFRNELDLATGKQTYQPVNVNGNRNFSFWGNWSKEGGNKKWSKGFQVNGGGGRSVGFLNGQYNVNNFTNIDVGLDISYNNEGHINFSISPTMGYNTSRSSLQPGRKTDYFTYGGQVETTVELPWKLTVEVRTTIEIREKVAGFSGSPNNYMVNGGVSRKFFKDNSGMLRFSFNDLLNQNVGFSRSINSNFISEERYNRIAQYFLLRFEWQFTKTPGK